MDVAVLQQFGVSLGLGILLGLQRERTERTVAGIRTFPMIALLGTVCAQVGDRHGGWVIAAGLLGLAVLIGVANVVKTRSGEADPGMTTEVAALLMFMLGAFIVVGGMAAAVVIGGGMLILLHMKEPMHRFAGAVGERDMRAIVQFVFLSLVVLPVLPREDFGPYEVFNPFKIWLMVVLIVGISLSGYVAYKLFGAKAGALVGGIIGGLISSTATTASYARRAATEPALASLAALVVMVASCVSLARVLVEIGVVAPGSFLAMAPPIAVLLGVSIAIAGALYVVGQKSGAELPEQENPAELKPAFIFAGLYALVLLAVAAAKDHFGNSGLFVVAVLSGLTDMDAITLSTAAMADSGGVNAATGWRAIMAAAMANFAFKFGMVAALGTRALTLRVAAAFGAAIVAGGLIIWLWPG